MTRTIVESKTKTAIIGFDQPFCVIGERINPTGRKKLAAELEAGDFSTVEKDALEQVACGAQVLDVNAGVVYNSNPNPNETEPPLMRQVIELVQGLVDVPLCIDSSVPGALEAGLQTAQGRPLLNSVTGEEERLEEILPLVKKYNVPVVAISNDDTGISEDPDVRFAVAKKIVERAADYGIPAHDIVVDPLVMPVGAMGTAGIQVFSLVRRLREELGVNTTCGASNISFGLPNRHGINNAFLAMASAAGMTSAIMNPVAMPKTKKMVGDRLDELKALGATAPDDVDLDAVAPLLGMAAAEDIVKERLARLADLGIELPEGIEIAKIAPLLGLSPKVGVASDEVISIRAADFLLDHDPSGGNWIKLNKTGAPGGGAGGRGGRRRRRG
ncbi:methyltetrahydrofolate cobalamin methyltransferase [Lutimaribacter sp. EGI FJ00015]|uniref:Methyltetrahydrofolate cobalamin methyltransferase n=1 Tax=Lutimaribacter degradans TaxID=2945989 RepID=A0ACC5ZXI9_9RHOB|nr:methyltetrahydrofolate cobalamin methyltransferase [Lutimaribacter sp. EGI FJ00013]MCM2562269.1 methyltetrahydrofolate cobalamin methyltransferase [Lutimaribacter sp. EGI FJ00013]MCO0613424.1 methyltetrahydrofolate cobalamin methyltransferase [Lutimaribacter sp. EGI FJ00015]MCO0636398.1 methyltetrahydrofolate cobalamin methyltransferase [Lutimaribacter sp. EGI FJ00014]